MAGEASGEYALDGLAVPETLNLLHDLLARVGREHPGVGAEDLSMFETAVIEIAGNMVEHGVAPGGVTYGLRLDVRPDRLVATLWESGEPVPDAEGRSADELPEVWSERGRGLALAGTVLDELTYQRVAGGNRWQLTRLRH
jgi:serine/threonine-protein kinase RsbW